MWFQYQQDACRDWRCATAGCLGVAEHRLEADGVGANYCGNCRFEIEQRQKLFDCFEAGMSYGQGCAIDGGDGSTTQQAFQKWLNTTEEQD